MSRYDEIQEVLRVADEKWGDRQPCLGCPHSPACADLEVACGHFRSWVQGTPAYGERVPSKRHWLAVFGGGEK